MNQEQLEMLSVKSAVERTIQGMIAVSNQVQTSSEAFFDDVERYMASLFVSKQIKNTYIVRPVRNSIEVGFTAEHGHTTLVTIFLPDHLQWKPPAPFVVVPTKVVDVPRVDTPPDEPWMEVVDTLEQDKVVTDIVDKIDNVGAGLKHLANDAIGRETVKAAIRNIVTSVCPYAEFFWITCDETNNPPSVRDNHTIASLLELQLHEGSDMIKLQSTFTIAASRPKRIVDRSDSIISDFLIALFDTLDDVCTKSHITDITAFNKKVVGIMQWNEKNNVYDFEFDPVLTIHMIGKSLVVQGSLILRPYEDSHEVTYPIFHVVTGNK